MNRTLKFFAEPSWSMLDIFGLVGCVAAWDYLVWWGAVLATVGIAVGVGVPSLIYWAQDDQESRTRKHREQAGKDLEDLFRRWLTADSTMPNPYTTEVAYMAFLLEQYKMKLKGR